MESKELRIGNLVTDDYYDSFKTVFEIESITSDGINVFANDDNAAYGMHSAILDYDYKLNEIKPIPLAEEWLVKMGFKKFVTSDKYHTYALGVINVNDNIVYVSELGFLNHIKYVHQLQNLYFDLTGEELTV